jgi:hypothetical protein
MNDALNFGESRLLTINQFLTPLTQSDHSLLTRMP